MQVEIWSDLACPWCYIGKRRFEAALEQFDHREQVRVTWRSFELDPGAPRIRDEDAATHLAHKYGMSREQALQGQERLTQIAAEVGLEYHLDQLRLGNTFDAHRLTHLAAEHGLQDEVAERLFRAYLTDGQALAEHDTLRAVARDAGLPDDEVADLLASDRFAAEVREDEALARAIGISAVPFFVIDRAFGTAGAQPSELLLEGLWRAWERALAA